MKTLSKKEKEFVAIGAAIASNCVPCIIYHIGESRKLGIPDEKIKEAVELADHIKKVPATKVLQTASSHLGLTVGEVKEQGEPKQCGS